MLQGLKIYLYQSKLKENISICKQPFIIIDLYLGEGQVIKYLSVDIFRLFTMKSQLITGPECQARIRDGVVWLRPPLAFSWETASFY